MKRILELDGIVDGDTKTDLVEMFSELENSFTQRKSFYEYYYQQNEIELTIDKIDKLSKDYEIRIDFDSVKIK
jgi:hypothetical protein